MIRTYENEAEKFSNEELVEALIYVSVRHCESDHTEALNNLKKEVLKRLSKKERKKIYVQRTR